MKKIALILFMMFALILTGCSRPPSAGPQPLLGVPQKTRDAVQLENERTSNLQQAATETAR